jgi:hypothetical protein
MHLATAGRWKTCLKNDTEESRRARVAHTCVTFETFAAIIFTKLFFSCAASFVSDGLIEPSGCYLVTDRFGGTCLNLKYHSMPLLNY